MNTNNRKGKNEQNGISQCFAGSARRSKQDQATTVIAQRRRGYTAVFDNVEIREKTERVEMTPQEIEKRIEQAGKLIELANDILDGTGHAMAETETGAIGIFLFRRNVNALDEVRKEYIPR